MPIIFARTKKSVEIARAVKAGKLRKLAPKLYTDDLKSPPEEIISRHRLEIAAHFYPGAVISYRSALEGNLSPGGKLHLSLPGAVAPVRKLPGLEIRIWRGPGPQPEDARTPIGEGEGLFTSGQARAVLENLQIARAPAGDESKSLSSTQLEQWIDRYLRIYGSAWLDQLQRQVAEIAGRMAWKREGEKFNQLVAAIRGTPSNHKLTTELLRARARGKPYDPERLRLFTLLHARLAAEHFPELERTLPTEYDNRAFWEAYFSNFIEGTKFSVDEARVIIYDQTAAKDLTAKRPEDAHDVRETYRLIIDPHISHEIPADSSHFLELLKRRHARMMASRLQIKPGVFKSKNNEFGSTVFVAPDLVAETLAQSWPASRTLTSPVARSLFVLFVISEVHPFIDGNGRISRLGMNAELEAAGQPRLIIPTSLRNDYLSVLQAMTVKANPDPLMRFGHKLIDLNSRMPFGSFEESLLHFQKSGALDDHSTSSGLTPAIFDAQSVIIQKSPG